MPTPVLTDGATFSCAHQGKAVPGAGLAISLLASQVTAAGHRPILAGATISGFAGCTNQVGPPCAMFALTAPSGNALTIGGMAVYTMADAAAIAAVTESTNGFPGLTAIEPQTVLLA